MKAPRGLLAITPGVVHDRGSARALVIELAEAFEAGLRAVSIREPRLADAELLELVREVLALGTGCGGVWVGLHDSLHVALAARAHGVHLGFRSLPVEVVCGMQVGELTLGFSAHASDGPSSVAVEGADYLTFGPVLETPSKVGLVEATGFGELQSFAEAVKAPVFALGGIGVEEVPQALAAGAAGVAVIRGLFDAERIGDATACYLAALAAYGGWA